MSKYSLFFEFESRSLDWHSIEDGICKYCEAGCAQSSNFMEIQEGQGRSVYIDASKAGVDCYVMAQKKIDSDNYTVSVKATVTPK